MFFVCFPRLVHKFLVVLSDFHPVRVIFFLLYFSERGGEGGAHLLPARIKVLNVTIKVCCICFLD